VLPYFPQPQIGIGPFTLRPFGALMVASLLVGRQMSIHRARRLGMPDIAPNPFTLAIVLAGLIGAHLDKVVLDHPRDFLADPLIVLRDWSGIASFGGLLGGLLGGLWWMRHLRLTWAQRFQFLDVFAYVFPFAWPFGRLGCTLANDHRGMLTNSWLAVRYPEGARYNLGLVELIFTLLLAAWFAWFDRKPRPVGFFFGLLGIVYGGFRLFLDTLHYDPIRYFGVTLDQIGGAVTMLVGACGLALALRPTPPSSSPLPPSPPNHRAPSGASTPA
jgi:phosphatidylglycerol:prolipoprotein diacylglycerol transferase